MAKYLIVMTCNEDGEPSYTDFVNMLFDNREIAEREMKKCIEQEVEELNNPDSLYYSEGNCVFDGCGFCLTEYYIAEITKEYKKEDVSSKDEVLSESFPDVSPAMYESTLCAFRHYFEIDDNDEEYACGSLEKLAIIIGKDYRYSDLLFEVAQNIIDNIDTNFGVPYEAWEDSIKSVIGEDKYEMAFEEWYPDIPEITDVIRSYQEDLDFSNRDIKYIERNENLMAAIFFAIVEYLDDTDVVWDEIDMSKNSTDDNLFGLLDVIRETYRNF